MILELHHVPRVIHHKHGYAIISRKHLYDKLLAASTSCFFVEKLPYCSSKKIQISEADGQSATDGLRVRDVANFIFVHIAAESFSGLSSE